MILLFLLYFSSSLWGQSRDVTEYVDSMIGNSDSRWMQFPGPAMPFGMVKLSPDNQGNVWRGGYEYKINQIIGFSHIHSWTMGGLLTMPVTGPLKIKPGEENEPDSGYRFFINSKATNPFMQMDFGGNNLNGMMQAYADDYWSESNRNIYATFPRLSTTDIANNNRNSTWWLRDGSYLRLKSVEIGYTLPKRLTSHLGMSNLRIYASGLNLFAWNRFKLWDVEQGNDGMQYPIQAVYNFGINLSF